MYERNGISILLYPNFGTHQQNWVCQFPGSFAGGLPWGIIHDITSYHQYQPFATNSLVFHCYIRSAEDDVNNPSYGVFTYTYIPNRYKSHHGVGDVVFRSIVCFSPARNGRIAHQPVNGTIPSELVKLFCKIVNGVLRLFDVMRIEQAEPETSCFWNYALLRHSGGECSAKKPIV